MKSRVITLFGRTGSILLVAGLALALVYTFSLRPSGRVYAPTFTVAPGRYGIAVSQTCSVLNGLHISVTFNSSLRIYVLGTHPLELMERIRSMITEQFPDLSESQIRWAMYSASVLEAFLSIHAREILLNETVNGEWAVDFFPARVTNVTVVVSNLLLMPTSASMEMTPVVSIVPREGTVMLTEALVVSGMVLALPLAAKKTTDYVRSR